MLVEPGLRGALSSSGGKLLGPKQRKVCEKEGGPMEGERRGGEEVWTTDKEARGRAERKQRCMDTVIGENDVYRPDTHAVHTLQIMNRHVVPGASVSGHALSCARTFVSVLGKRTMYM